MKRLTLFIIGSLCFGAFLVMAAGPVYHHKEPEKELEFEHVYNDINFVKNSYLKKCSGIFCVNDTINGIKIGTETVTLGGNEPRLYIVKNASGANTGMSLELFNYWDGGNRWYLESEGGNPVHSRAFIGQIYGSGFPGTWWVGGPSIANSIGFQEDQGASYNVGTATAAAFVMELECQNSYWHTSASNLIFKFLSGTATHFELNSGALSLPLNPSFEVYASATLSNVTGDGTAYTIAWNTEVRDAASNFASNTFTAPVTGVYHFDVGVLVSGLTTSHADGYVSLVTSNRTYYLGYFNKGAVAITEWQLGKGVDADMDVSDTATVLLTVNGTGKTADILGGSTLYTYWTGRLAQ